MILPPIPPPEPVQGESGTPQVSCDLCGYPMPLPAVCQEQGAVLGLLVCSQCAEDELCSRVGGHA